MVRTCTHITLNAMLTVILAGFFDDPDQFADNVYIARITEWKERSVNFAAKG